VNPTRLTVLYDGNCPVCRQAGSWLGRQPQLVPIRLVKAGSETARRLYPGLDHDATLRDITVVATVHDGRQRWPEAVYVGDAAWLICLWALDAYRALSIRLAQPGLRGAARQVVAMASQARRATRNRLREDDGCDSDACATR
jgi:predicted DCC family thiol-disulfide oxidoreductase YuxK